MSDSERCRKDSSNRRGMADKQIRTRSGRGRSDVPVQQPQGQGRPDSAAQEAAMSTIGGINSAGPLPALPPEGLDLGPGHRRVTQHDLIMYRALVGGQGARECRSRRISTPFEAVEPQGAAPPDRGLLPGRDPKSERRGTAGVGAARRPRRPSQDSRSPVAPRGLITGNRSGKISFNVSEESEAERPGVASEQHSPDPPDCPLLWAVEPAPPAALAPRPYSASSCFTIAS